MDKMNIYNRLPVWGQNLACYYEGRRIQRTRYGKIFWQKLEEYESHNNWSYEQLCDYRDAKLRKMVHHCYNTVPYYHKLFNEGGINPDKIETPEDLKFLPILTKQIVNENPENFISTAYPRTKMVTAHTSGTTGSGFVFKTTQEAICDQWAVWWRYRKRLGIQFGTWSANFGTRFIVPPNQEKPPYWRYNGPCKQIYFSAFHESPNNLNSYVEELIKKKISWVHGYPSLLSVLADYILAENINLNGQIRYVTTGAENLLEHQRRVLKEAFGVEPYEHYGLSEGVANFSEQIDRRIIIDEDFSVVELIPYGETNRIIASNLNNYAMPLLRWDTKDTATYFEDPIDGRVISSIDGRIEDYVFLPDGTRVGKLDHVFKDTIHLKEVQIYQKRDYSIIVYAVTDGSDPTGDIRIAKELMQKSFSVSLPIEFAIVESLRKKPNEKLRFVVSEIKG